MFKLDTPQTVSKIGFNILAYAVNKNTSTFNINCAWVYDDATTENFDVIISEYDEQGNYSGKFEDFYAVFDNEEKLYYYIAQELQLTGELIDDK